MHKHLPHAKLMYIRTPAADDLDLIVAYTTPAERGRYLYALAGTDPQPPNLDHCTALMLIRAESVAVLDHITKHTTPDERGRYLSALARAHAPARAQGEAAPC